MAETYWSLEAALEPHIEKDFKCLPEHLQAAWQQRFAIFGGSGLWDNQYPAGRRHLAQQRDADEDPANEAAQLHMLGLVDRKSEIERQLRKWQAIPTPAAQDLHLAETKVAELRSALAAVDAEIRALTHPVPDHQPQSVPCAQAAAEQSVVTTQVHRTEDPSSISVQSGLEPSGVAGVQLLAELSGSLALTQPSLPVATPCIEQAAKDIAYHRLTTPSVLLEAFRVYGLKKDWFNQPSSHPWLLAARKVKGAGKRGLRTIEPMYCPFEVMKGLVHSVKNPKLTEERGWQILRDRFQQSWNHFREFDPRTLAS